MRWPRMFGAAVLPGALILGLSFGRAGAVPVDLELVLPVDVSFSVNEAEFRTQTQGLAMAFRDPLAEAPRAGLRHHRSARNRCCLAEHEISRHEDAGT